MSKIPTAFEYRGLTFKIVSKKTSVLVKQGRRHVLKQLDANEAIPREKVIRELIQSVKDGVNQGYGLNLDYSKVE